MKFELFCAREECKSRIDEGTVCRRCGCEEVILMMDGTHNVYLGEISEEELEMVLEELKSAEMKLLGNLPSSSISAGGGDQPPGDPFRRSPDPDN